MELHANIKQKLADSVAGKLSAAPDSTAKAELIEELSDNLYHHYQDLTASGLDQEEAYRQALDCLGDADELVEYLNSLQPDESLPELVLHPEQGDSGQLEDLLKNVEEIVKGALHKAKSALQDAKDITEDNLGVSMEDMAKGAKEKMGQAFQKARSAVENTVSSWGSGDSGTPCEPAEEPGTTQAPGADDGEAPDASAPGSQDGRAESRQEASPGSGDSGAEQDPHGGSRSWQFTAGYDKSRGGFYAQWDGPKGGQAAAPVPLDGPVCGDALVGLDVQVSGDVTIRLTEAEDGDVVIGGDLEWLEASRSDDGVLTIRQNTKTASSSFFFGRGLQAADVTLALPRRYWKFLRVSTASGDVEIAGGVALGLVTVKTASGDLRGHLPQCEQLTFHSASGDLDWEGCAGEAQLETVSGDLTYRGQLSRIGTLTCKSVSGDIDWEGTAQEVRMQTVSGDVILNGQLGQIQASTVSGEIELAGAVNTAVRCSSSSGSIRVESAQLPQRMELSSKSGDCEVRIPDSGPFTLHFKTASGRFRTSFAPEPPAGRSGSFSYRLDGSPDSPASYHMSSVSGNVSLFKY